MRHGDSKAKEKAGEERMRLYLQSLKDEGKLDCDPIHYGCGKVSHAGDFGVTVNGKNVCVEAKHYRPKGFWKGRIGPVDRWKFYWDVHDGQDGGFDGGVLVMVHSTVDCDWSRKLKQEQVKIEENKVYFVNEKPVVFVSVRDRDYPLHGHERSGKLDEDDRGTLERAILKVVSAARQEWRGTT